MCAANQGQEAARPARVDGEYVAGRAHASRKVAAVAVAEAVAGARMVATAAEVEVEAETAGAIESERRRAVDLLAGISAEDRSERFRNDFGRRGWWPHVIRTSIIVLG